jgi:putative phosphoesterase
MRVAILSDTHGLLRPEVPGLIAGCDRILHAGDVGDPQILDRLRAIAPLEVVRGNVDHGELAGLPEIVEGDLEGLKFRMTHRREDVLESWTRDTQLIVFGHSHRPEMEWRGACLLLNPGAIGPRRFVLPLTLAILTVRERRLIPELIAVE